VNAPIENSGLNNHRAPEDDASNHEATTRLQSNATPQRKILGH